jgi:hypothetical protein
MALKDYPSAIVTPNGILLCTGELVRFVDLRTREQKDYDEAMGYLDRF